ncbi:NME NM23 member 5 [Boothiomyces sp. JEL0866]|nr:NME NM23 member 5 [Boothiomyces sp. JEL0866]
MNKALLLLKPSVTHLENEVKLKLKNHGYKFLDKKVAKLTPEQATDFFQDKMDLPNFNELVDYMTSGNVVAFIVCRQNVFEELSTTVGRENPVVARAETPESLRALYGESRLKNGFHYSESIEHAKREIQFFFPNNIVEPLPNMETTKMFLDDAVYPILLAGMTALCKEKPQNPIEWLGDWLLNHNPNKPIIQEPAE